MQPKKPKPTPPTVQERLELARQAFRDEGISVAEWARAHGFNRMTVVDVLRGSRVGHRGEAHKVAVALGLKKAGRAANAKNFKPIQEAA